MPEASFAREEYEYLVAAVGATSAGVLWQMPDGRWSYQNMGAAAGASTSVKFRDSGKVYVPKSTGVAFVDGDPVYFDYSARTATYKPVVHRDSFIGTAVGDWESANGFMQVDLNKKPHYSADLFSGGFQTVVTGTQGGTDGFMHPKNLGGAHVFELTTTNEVQKVDALGIEGFSPDSNWIVNVVYGVISDGAGSEPDLNIGIASATHATDADSIAEHLFLHHDGNATPINLQSKDGTTTVTAVDTTYDHTEGSTYAQLIYATLDGRNPADIQCYVNGVLALPSSTFRLDNAVGPLYPIVHLEKTSSASVFKAHVLKVAARVCEQ